MSQLSTLKKFFSKVIRLYSLWSWTLGRSRQLGACLHYPGSRVPGEESYSTDLLFTIIYNCDLRQQYGWQFRRDSCLSLWHWLVTQKYIATQIGTLPFSYLGYTAIAFESRCLLAWVTLVSHWNLFNFFCNHLVYNFACRHIHCRVHHWPVLVCVPRPAWSRPESIINTVD